MSTRSDQIGERYRELRREGMSPAGAAAVVNEEFGRKLTERTIKGYASRLPKDEATTRPDTADLDAHIRTIAREVCEEVMKETQHRAPDTRSVVEMPQAATIKGMGKGRKENRVYARITAAVDATLYERLQEERKERGLSEGKMLDLALWERYDRPPLSFQLDEAEYEHLQRKYKKKRTNN